jgi:hypothetical protein
LERAIALRVKAKLGIEPALKSASWGMDQVMEFNHELAGFKSAAQMIQAMVRSEDAQLVAMAEFLKANGLATLSRKKDWTGFAKRYSSLTS